MDTIYDGFLETARRDPTATAIIDEHGEVSYQQLEHMANEIAARLPEQARFVGIIMDHSAEMIAAILATLKQGAAYVPAEPDFPPARIAFMMNECQADALITQKDSPALASLAAPRIMIEPGSLRSVRDQKPSTVSQAHPDDLAYILYTSGTTGTPKGVSVENRNVRAYIRAFQDEFSLTSADRMLQHSVCSFDIFVEEVFSTLLAGATLVIAPKNVKEDPAALIAFINEQAITIVDGFPYLLDDINAQPDRPSMVRLYISGGDVLHASQVSNLVNEAMVYNTYGPSETTCCASYFRCDNAKPLDDGTYPVGHPIKGTSIAVVDENLKPVSQGELGEFVISGAGVSRGYLTPHPDQANFTESPDGVRHYRSGDMGYVDAQGNLVFLHRKDDQVMIRGKRVEAKEVENVLLQDEAVHQAVVVPARDEAGFSYLIAYLVPMADDFSLAELRSRLAHHLAPFMIPEFFVKMNAIPLNTHGKPAVEELPIVLKEGDR